MNCIVFPGLLSLVVASGFVACKVRDYNGAVQSSSRDLVWPEGALFQNERTDKLTVLNNRTVTLDLIEGIHLKATLSPFPQGGTGATMWWVEEVAPTGSRASCNTGARYKAFFQPSDQNLNVDLIEESELNIDASAKGSLVCGKFVPKFFSRKK